MAMELGNIAQGHKASNITVTTTVFFLDQDAIKNIFTNKKVKYTGIVVE